MTPKRSESSSYYEQKKSEANFTNAEDCIQQENLSEDRLSQPSSRKLVKTNEEVLSQKNRAAKISKNMLCDSSASVSSDERKRSRSESIKNSVILCTTQIFSPRFYFAFQNDNYSYLSIVILYFERWKKFIFRRQKMEILILWNFNLDSNYLMLSLFV